MLYNAIIHFISNFNILEIKEITDILWWICLFFDGIVYSLVAYAYNIFIIIAGINFNVLSQWFAPIINRIESLILVLIMFKLGISFITYMVNPDIFKDGKKGGPGLLKNILIVAIFLISYGFIFDVFNELTMLVIGYPEDYDFVVLKDIAGVDNSEKKANAGLLNRLIFGSEEIPSDYGNNLSRTILERFISGPAASAVFGEIVNSSPTGDNGTQEINMMNITELADKINTGEDGADYHWPVLSNIVGIYVIITIVKISIEIAIRMFKLVTLRLASPLVIITMVDDGFDSKYFKDFVKVYMSEYTSLFIRILVMYLITAFISMLDGGFGAIMPSAGAITNALIFVLLVVAAFKFVNELPKLIDSIAGTKLSADGKGSGFGKFLGGLAGTVLGAAGGLAAGIAGGAGVLGTAANVIGGGVRGAQNGSKSQNVADFFKNNGEVRKGNAERAANISRMGGLGQYTLGKAESALGISQTRAAQAQYQKDTRKALDNMMEARRGALTEKKNERYGFRYGSTEDETVGKAHKTDEYLKRQAALQAAAAKMNNATGNPDAFKAAEAEYQKRLKAVNDFDKQVKSDYMRDLMSNKLAEEDAYVAETTKAFNDRADAGYDVAAISSGIFTDIDGVVHDMSFDKDGLTYNGMKLEASTTMDTDSNKPVSYFDEQGNVVLKYDTDKKAYVDYNGTVHDEINVKDAVKYAGYHYGGAARSYEAKGSARRANRTGRYQ